MAGGDAGRRISAGAREVNGITDAMLEEAPGPDEVFPALYRFIKGAILVVHNARFDMAFLLNEFKRLGMAFPNRHRCTYELSRKLYPHLANFRLDTVYQHLFGVEPDNTTRHRALDDARMTARFWLRMTKNG